MDNTVVKEIRDIGGRLDGVISFTIIRFIYAVCVVHLRPVEVVLFGGITGIVFSLVLHSRSISNATRIVSDLVRKVSLLVVAQASVAVLGVDATLQYASVHGGVTDAVRVAVDDGRHVYLDTLHCSAAVFPEI